MVPYIQPEEGVGQRLGMDIPDQFFPDPLTEEHFQIRDFQEDTPEVEEIFSRGEKEVIPRNKDDEENFKKESAEIEDINSAPKVGEDVNPFKNRPKSLLPDFQALICEVCNQVFGYKLALLDHQIRDHGKIGQSGKFSFKVGNSIKLQDKADKTSTANKSVPRASKNDSPLAQSLKVNINSNTALKDLVPSASIDNRNPQKRKIVEISSDDLGIHIRLVFFQTCNNII